MPIPARPNTTNHIHPGTPPDRCSADAGVASGLLNTSRQVGGAVGLAVVNAIAAGFAVDGVSGATGESLAHGYRVALLVLAMLALAGAVLSSTLLAPPRPLEVEEPLDERVREAA